MSSLRYNLLQTTLSVSIDDSGTTINFSGPLLETNGDYVETLVSPFYIWLQVESELMQLTEYTEESLNGTVVRGQGATMPSFHGQGVQVRNVATKEDYLPNDLGLTYDSTETDTNRIAAIESIISAYGLATDSA